MVRLQGLFKDIRTLLRPKRNSHVFNNYYTAYNLAGLSEYSIINNDSLLVKRLRKKADSWINQNGKLNYELVRVDQAPIGIFYLNLYKLTIDKKYLLVANHIFEYLKSKRINNSNIIPYHSEVNNFSDAIGMYVPFLMEYYKTTGNILAKDIAITNILEYKKHGTDLKTGIPSHGYNINTGIKLGSSNWGRGIGWYLLAIAYCPELNDDLLLTSVNKLPYTQFPLSSNKYDSSTALMFEIYKQSVGNTKLKNLDFIKTHIRKNGFVADCSGDTYDLNGYSGSFGSNELCNGLLLILYSKSNNNPLFNQI